jgi:glutamate formiminotransferase/formiminotetrahydrofolate cyclodeaminase
MNQPFDLNAFIDQLASGEPTPGGGSAAALAGALGAALVTMVGRLTAGRKRFAAVEDEMQRTIDAAERLLGQLAGLTERDAAAYEMVRSAYRLPKETDAERSARHAAIQDGLRAASLTPLETVEACADVMRLALRVAQAGNPAASTDACVGALLAHAGLQGAVLNVRANLTDIDDAAFASHSEALAALALRDAAEMLRSTLAAAGQSL